MQQSYTTIDRLSTPNGGRTLREKCPVHGGKKKSVAVWWNNGPRAYCHSHQCSQTEILAGLGITSSQPFAWTPPPPPRLRSTISAKPLLPVTPIQGRAYLAGIPANRREWIQYQRQDGLLGWHWRQGSDRKVPGIKGNGWQLRRFDPADPASAVAICLAEGEKDSAILAAAGLISFCGPRGAQSLPSADFSEMAELAGSTGLPILLIGDNDEPGRKAMEKVRGLLKSDFHVDARDLSSLGEDKGSVADQPAEDLIALIRVKLLDRDPIWQKPGRNRCQYVKFQCPRPKKNIKSAGDGAGIWGMISCGNTAVCKECCAWEGFLHVERCWRGRPAQMVTISGFGEDASTIPQTTWLAKAYRGHFEERLRKNADVNQKQENPSSKRQHFMTALKVGHDYRASLAFFLASPLTAKQLAKERTRAEAAGLGFKVVDTVTYEDVVLAAPPSLTIHMEGEGSTTTTHCWSASHWPTWWQPETTYCFSDGVDLEDGEDFPDSSISAKAWRREYHQEWNGKKSLKDNLIDREEHALFNSTLWMTNCFGLGLETLYGIARGEGIEALIQEISDYSGPTSLLRDAAGWLAGHREWRKAFRPVLDAAGWRPGRGEANIP